MFFKIILWLCVIYWIYRALRSGPAGNARRSPAHISCRNCGAAVHPVAGERTSGLCPACFRAHNLRQPVRPELTSAASSRPARFVAEPPSDFVAIDRVIERTLVFAEGHVVTPMDDGAGTSTIEMQLKQGGEQHGTAVAVLDTLGTAGPGAFIVNAAVAESVSVPLLRRYSGITTVFAKPSSEDSEEGIAQLRRWIEGIRKPNNMSGVRVALLDPCKDDAYHPVLAELNEGLPVPPAPPVIRPSHKPPVPVPATSPEAVGTVPLQEANPPTAWRYFEYIGGKSRKFWAIRITGNAYDVQFGRLGTHGQRRGKQFATGETARIEGEKLVRSKVRKGYVEAALPGDFGG